MSTCCTLYCYFTNPLPHGTVISTPGFFYCHRTHPSSCEGVQEQTHTSLHCIPETVVCVDFGVVDVAHSLTPMLISNSNRVATLCHVQVIPCGQCKYGRTLSQSLVILERCVRIWGQKKRFRSKEQNQIQFSNNVCWCPLGKNLYRASIFPHSWTPDGG